MGRSEQDSPFAFIHPAREAFTKILGLRHPTKILQILFFSLLIWSILHGQLLAVACLVIILLGLKKSPISLSAQDEFKKEWLYLVGPWLGALFFSAYSAQGSTSHLIALPLIFFSFQCFSEKRSLLFLSQIFNAIIFIGPSFGLGDQPVTSGDVQSLGFYLQQGVSTALYFGSAVWLVQRQNNDVIRFHDEPMNTNLKFKSLIRIACHNISNPLTLILGSCQLVQLPKYRNDPKLMLNFWSKVELASESINDVLSTLRAFEALQQPQRIVLRESPLIPILEESSIALKEQFDTKKVTLELDTSALKKHDVVLIDPHFFGLCCVRKILANALYFSEVESKIYLSTTLIDQKSLKITVEDDASGFDAETLKNLHNSDFMKNEVRSPGAKGAGFGLSIVKLLMESMNGQLEIESPINLDTSPSRGSRVSLILPLQKKVSA